ncbi:MULTISPECIES: hypothetical protein [Pseudomonas]|uniref:hypothetical protein n=1 Tax=Pseudomonas TaxID=286 RepID=UPI0006B58404|nr:hypothetical protein [Pseudomonas fuscovaginae]KPA96575.1 hypothetical protein PF70_03376 [Pseudomonas fuscovaginae]
MSILFDESGMRFGPYDEDKFFPIERSSVYRKSGEGVKIAEFVLVRTSSKGAEEAWVVEAKSSIPRDFTMFMGEIRQKLTNAVQLTIASCLGRHGDAAAELPVALKELDIGSCGFKLVLIILGAPKEKLPGLNDALKKEMKSLVKTLGFEPTSVSVINDIKARDIGLIV